MAGNKGTLPGSKPLAQLPGWAGGGDPANDGAVTTADSTVSGAVRLAFPPDPSISKTTSVTAKIASFDQQIEVVLLQDSFVAKNSTVAIAVGITGSAIGAARMTFNFYLGGANQALPVYTATGTPVAGATNYNIGSVWSDTQATAKRRFIVRNLTVGATYNWQLMGGIVGGAFNNLTRSDTATWTNGSPVVTDTSIVPGDTGQPVFSAQTGIPLQAYVGSVINGVSFRLSSSPVSQVDVNATVTQTSQTLLIGPFNNCHSVAVRSGLAAPHNVDKAYVVNYAPASGGMQVIPVVLGGRGYGNVGGSIYSGYGGGQSAPNWWTGLQGNAQRYGSTIGPPIQGTTLTNGWDVAFTPDGTQACVVGFGSNAVNVINADTDLLKSAFTPAALGTVSVGVVCDNTYAYIANFTNSNVIRMKLSDGTTTALTMGAACGNYIAMTPDLATILVPLRNGKVQAITASTFALGTLYDLTGLSAGGSGAVGASTILTGICTTDPNTAWAVCQTATNNIIVRINLASSTFTAYAPWSALQTLNKCVPSPWSSRTDSTGVTVTNGSPVVLDSSITYQDQWRYVSGTGIPTGTYIGTIVNGTSFRLSSSNSSQVDVNATAGGTSITVQGTHNLWVINQAGTPRAIQMWASGPYVGQMFTIVTMTTDAEGIAITNDGQIYQATGTYNSLFEWPGSSFYMTPSGQSNDYFEVNVEGGQ